MLPSNYYLLPPHLVEGSLPFELICKNIQFGNKLREFVSLSQGEATRRLTINHLIDKPVNGNQGAVNLVGIMDSNIESNGDKRQYDRTDEY